jgi:N-acetylneuraminic acid mutarotase
MAAGDWSMVQRGRVWLAVLAFAALACLHSSARAQCACPGDCGADCLIGEDDLRNAVHAIFDPGAFLACSAADADGSGRVTAADIVRITLTILDPPAGCTREPTKTSTNTPTVTRSATSTNTPTPPPSATSTPTPTRTATPSATRSGTPASMWTTLAPLPGGGRQELGAALVGDEIFVIGGLDTQQRGSRRVDVYDTVSDEWRPAADLPQALHHVGVGAVGDQVYSVGGFTGGLSFNPTAVVSRYDPQQDEWFPAASLPRARGALGVAVADGLLYATGGTAVGTSSVTDHAVYDRETNEWTPLAPLPSPRNHLAAAAIDGLIYVVGGREGSAFESSTELNRYDPGTDTWETLAPMPTERSGLGAAVLNGRLVVMGGEANQDHPDLVYPQVEAYDPATNRWTSLDPMPVPRHGIWIVTAGNRIHVPGGATIAGFEAVAHHDALEVFW